MKKGIKIILIILGIIVAIILLDTLQARIFKNSPFISWKVELEDDDSWVYKGILMDTFYCTEEKDIVTVSWKFKGTKFTCPIDDVEIDELDEINDKITKYFSSDDASYSNYSFSYVDEEEMVVVVGLIDNSSDEQKKFKEEVVDSDLIKFVEGRFNIGHNQETENIIEKPTLPENEIITKDIMIENYVGMNYFIAKAELESMGLKVDVKEVSSSNSAGTVVSQSIKPGKYTIKLENDKIIEGIKVITITIPVVENLYPDFTTGEYNLDDIYNFADAYNIVLTLVKENSDLPSGTIISQSRKPGTSVVAGTKLTITVSE